MRIPDFLSLVAVMMLACALKSCHSDSSSAGYSNSRHSYQSTKMSLEEQEKGNPLSFLSCDGTYRKNLLGEWVLEGTISSSASVAEYKDVVLEVHFYSKTNTDLGTEYHTVYEYFPPGKSKRFKIKTYGYKGAKKVGWNVSGASAQG